MTASGVKPPLRLAASGRRRIIHCNTSGRRGKPPAPIHSFGRRGKLAPTSGGFWPGGVVSIGRRKVAPTILLHHVCRRGGFIPPYHLADEVNSSLRLAVSGGRNKLAPTINLKHIAATPWIIAPMTNLTTSDGIT